MVKVLWYLLFLCVYVTAAFAFYGILEKLKRTARVPLWVQEAGQLIVAGLLYLTLVLLARYSSLLIVGFYLLSAQVPILLDAVLNATQVGQEKDRYQAEVRWGAECFSLKHFEWMVIVGLVSNIVFLAFPVLAGIVYFSNAVPSATATVAVIRVTLFTLFVGGVALSLPTQVAVPFSENLSGPVRRRFFLGLSASLVPNGLLLATLLSTFNVSRRAAAHSSGNFRLAFSPLMLVILAAYFVAALLVPTVLGSMRGAQWNRQLRQLQQEAWAEGIEVLRAPGTDSYDTGLSRLAEKLQKSRDTLVNADKGVAFGLGLDELKVQEERNSLAIAVSNSSLPNIAEQKASVPDTITAPPEDGSSQRSPTEILNVPYYKVLRQSFDDSNYYVARPHDPRFVYLDSIDSLIQKLETTTKDLQSKASGSARRKAAREWADNYVTERESSVEVTSTKTNTLGAVAVSTVMTSLLTVFFTSFGDWLWTHIVHTLPK